MFSESEWMYERRQLHDLWQTHPDWSLRGYAQTLHHDLKWVRKWVQRFRLWISLNLEPSLEMVRSQSRRPDHSPKRLTDRVKDQICTLRESLSERFFRPAGAQTIQYYLKDALSQVPCAGSIYQTLHERGYVQPRPHVKPTPLNLPGPMEEWEMDFGEIYLGPTEGILEFFLVVDRGTSRVVYLEGSTGYNAESALEAVMRLFTKHGLPKRLRYDRDPRLWGSWTRDSYPSPLTRLLRVLGVEPIICPPHRPDKKPFVERCVETLKYEWLARYSPTTFADGLALLAPFIAYHNTQRPHQGQACNNQIPDEAFPTLPVLPTLPSVVVPNRWLEAEHGHIYRRRISANGSIQVDSHSYYVGQAEAGLAVLVQLDAQRRCLWVISDGKILKDLPLKGLYPDVLLLNDYVEQLKVEARLIEQYHHAHWEQTGDVL